VQVHGGTGPRGGSFLKGGCGKKGELEGREAQKADRRRSRRDGSAQGQPEDRDSWA